MENNAAQKFQPRKLRNGQPWKCVDCDKLLGVLVFQNTEYGTHTAFRIKNKDHVVLIEDPVSLTTVSTLCQYCASINQHAPVGDPSRLALFKQNTGG